MKQEKLGWDITWSQRKTSTHALPESYLDWRFDQHGNLNCPRYPLCSLKSQYYFLHPLKEVMPPSLWSGNNSVYSERGVHTGRYTYEHASVHYGNKHNCPSQAWHKAACAAGSVEGTTCTSKFPKRKQCQSLTTSLTHHFPNSLDLLTCC